MQIVGIVGSPVTGGNVDRLVTQVLAGAAAEGARMQVIYLNDLHIRPCQSCGVDPRPRYCVYDDGMGEVYRALEAAQGVVLGSPVYFDTVCAQVKLMIDRSNCLMPYVQRPDGTRSFEARMPGPKRGVFIAAAGIDQRFDAILATVVGFFRWANIELVETILYAHEDDEAGSVAHDSGLMALAYDVGRVLARAP